MIFLVKVLYCIEWLWVFVFVVDVCLVLDLEKIVSWLVCFRLDFVGKDGFFCLGNYFIIKNSCDYDEFFYVMFFEFWLMSWDVWCLRDGDLLWL